MRQKKKRAASVGDFLTGSKESLVIYIEIQRNRTVDFGKPGKADF